LEEYKKLRLKYERNKTTLAALKSRILPSQDFKKYKDRSKFRFSIQAAFEETNEVGIHH